MSASTLKSGSKDLQDAVNNHATLIDASTGSLALGARFLGFTGHNLAGACTLTGAKVGDTVTGVVNITDGGTASSSFEATITVADQIQQSAASDLSAKHFSVLLKARS